MRLYARCNFNLLRDVDAIVLQDAIDFAMRAVDLHERALGESNEHTIEARRILAQTLRQKSFTLKGEEQQRLREEVAQIHGNCLEWRRDHTEILHRHTILQMNNYGTALREVGGTGNL